MRLPKAVAFPDNIKKVDIIALGRTRLVVPTGQAWESWFAGESVTDDFMHSRDQPAEQEREAF
ncbi:MAG: type II toxin-antitoxin system VapB family antitoxin [Robiginitomaculum sp.]|nr:type II toxin-antitoxin system VapB family antitoxin [Robiginitomaculum sp.]